MLISEKILLQASHPSLRQDQLEILSGLISQNPSWNEIVAALRFHSLSPLLLKHLTEANLTESIPTAALQKIIGIARLQAARRLRIIVVFRELAEIFKENQIDFILLKGLFLADSCYENPGLRPMLDIDLLIKDEDLVKVTQVMKKLSAKPIVEKQSDFINSFLQHLPPFIYKEVLIEIHTRLNSPNLPYSFSREILWTNIRLVDIQKVQTRVFTSELNLIYLCTHVFRHLQTAKFRLIWFTDLLQLLKSEVHIDFNKFRQLTTDTNSGESISKTFFLLNTFWNLSISEEYSINPIEPDKRELRNFTDGFLRKKSPDEYYTYEAWKQIPGFRDKFRYLLGLLFPSPAYMKKKYSISYPLLLIPLYPYNSLKVFLKGLKLLISR